MTCLRDFARRSVPAVLCALLLTDAWTAHATTVPISERENPQWRVRRGLPLEYEDDAPAAPANGLRTTRAAGTITFGPYTSIQVNVDGFGNDILGDAANEPSLAVNPLDHDQMVIGWRQFDNVVSNFREAGYGYTVNGGANWIQGTIQNGTFRSDPVLDIDGFGNFFYNSLTSNASGILSWVFRSITGGATWTGPVFAYGGDKQWMAIDRDLGHFYQAWSIAGNNYFPQTFNKSIDGGASFQTPASIPHAPIWGTVAVGPDHWVYVAGWETQADSLTGNAAVAASWNAQNEDFSALFVTTVIDLGGTLRTGPPNPAGLLGQVWIGVDRSSSPRHNWLYVLASVAPDDDPMDVYFTRSTDQGLSWSPPVRVNDDAPGNRAFQWFGTMSVSPSGRIDAVWNDTRGSADSTVSALFYSYSADGGTTWSPNVQVTPAWSSMVGFPNQAKIGDYYDTTSDDTGVDVAYAATFNGGQDVFYLRIPNTVTGIPPQAAAPLRLDSTPNPFAGTTTIRFEAPASGGNVRVEIFDLAGHRVATLVDGFRTGAQSIAWNGRRDDGSDAAPGVYLCRMTAGSVTGTRKLLRVR